MSSINAELEGDVQPDVQRNAPNAERPTTGRSKDGRFLKGEPGARLTHGGRSVQVRLALIDARRAELSEHRDAILADLGGRESVGRLKTDLIERYLETSLIAEWLGGNLLVDGVLTSKGRTRAASTLYLQVIDRLYRLTTALGLERKPKDTMTLERYLQSRYSHQDATTASGEAQADSGSDRAVDAERSALVSLPEGDKA
jgi:hypothetical protein